MVTFKKEIYSEEEYKEYLQRNPIQNLLTTNYGVERIRVDRFDEQLQELKGLNEPTFRKNIRDKVQQSARAKRYAKEEAKRKTDGPAPNPPPSAKRGTANPVARSSSDVAQSSTSSSARAWLDRPQQPHPSEYYETDQWEEWDGRWYQKVYYHGRAEWQQWRGR
eukprot:s873_g12.t1